MGAIQPKSQPDLSFDSRSPINYSNVDIEKIEMEAIQQVKNVADNCYFGKLKKIRSSMKEGGDLSGEQHSSQSAKLKKKVKKEYKEDSREKKAAKTSKRNEKSKEKSQSSRKGTNETNDKNSKN